MEAILYCKPHYEYLYKETSTFDKDFHSLRQVVKMNCGVSGVIRMSFIEPAFILPHSIPNGKLGYFRGKALAEPPNERIESTVGWFEFHFSVYERLRSFWMSNRCKRL